MRKLWSGILVACVCATSATAQVSIGIATPGISIGIQLPAYPQLVAVPGYPVYYAPALNTNYFFYDGLYWVFQGNNWYASSWYNGPWSLVQPLYVPVYVLRVPVRYYRAPPPYFHPWRADAPPRWGERWGPGWQQQRKGWDQWNRHAVPAPAPLPVYQRQYGGDRYPHEAQRQQALSAQNYRYQPRDPMVREQHDAVAARERPPTRAPQPMAQEPERPPPPVAQKGPPQKSAPQGPAPSELHSNRSASPPPAAPPQKGPPQAKGNEKGNERGNGDHGRGQGGGKPQS